MEILGISHYPSDVVTTLSTCQNRTTIGLMLPVTARFWSSSLLLLVCLLCSCRSDLMQPCLLWDNKADGYSLMEISWCMTKWGSRGGTLSTSDDNYLCFDFECDCRIRSQICTCHYSCAVVAYAKLWPGRLIYLHIRARCSFARYGLWAPKAFVKCFPGCKMVCRLIVCHPTIISMA